MKSTDVGRSERVPAKATIPRALKARLTKLAQTDRRLDSESRILEAALTYFLRDYARAKGRLDPANHPVLDGSERR